jgi:hypothetical protein
MSACDGSAYARASADTRRREKRSARATCHHKPRSRRSDTLFLLMPMSTPSPEYTPERCYGAVGVATRRDVTMARCHARASMLSIFYAGVIPLFIRFMMSCRAAAICRLSSQLSLCYSRDMMKYVACHAHAAMAHHTSAAMLPRRARLISFCIRRAGVQAEVAGVHAAVACPLLSALPFPPRRPSRFPPATPSAARHPLPARLPRHPAARCRRAAHFAEAMPASSAPLLCALRHAAAAADAAASRASPHAIVAR